MKLTARIFMSLDGVYQGPGAPDEDRRGGFERGGWVAGHDDEVLGDYIATAYEQTDAMLLGRVTWDIWEAYWPHHDDHPIGHTINTVPKHIPSTTRTESTWHNTHFVNTDVESTVRELKGQPGRDLPVAGSAGWHRERAASAPCPAAYRSMRSSQITGMTRVVFVS